MDITPRDSRYIPLVQQRYCCVAACISMVMLRHGIPLIPQEELAYHLGLLVPREFRSLFCVTRTGRRPRSGYGTQIFDAAFEPNRVFRHLHISLRFKNYPIDDVVSADALLQFLYDGLKEDRDMLVCFDAATLYPASRSGGHVCVVDCVDLATEKIRLIDPSPNAPKWQWHSAQCLFDAMRAHGSYRSGGVWFFDLQASR